MSRNRQKGTYFENATRDFINQRVMHAPQVRRTEFSSPNGDLEGWDAWILEIKHQREQRLGYWLLQAKAAQDRTGKRWYAVLHNRRQARTENNYVTMTYSVFVDVVDYIALLERHCGEDGR